MQNYIFVISLIIGGSSAFSVYNFCKLRKCENGAIDNAFMHSIPTAEQMKTVCPHVIERFQCQRTAVEECFDDNLEELASSSNASISQFSRLVLNLENISTDICDENSPLHKGYASSVDCYNEVMYSSETNPECHQKAAAVYNAYKGSQNELGDTLRNKNDAECFKRAYTTACWSTELQDKCGDVAGATFVEILKRVQYVTLVLNDCTDDQFLELRTTFWEFLSFGEQKKALFSEVFNTRK